MAKITINKLFLMSSMKKQRNKKNHNERTTKKTTRWNYHHSLHLRENFINLTSSECLAIQNKIVGKTTMTTINEYISKQLSFYSKSLPFFPETKIENFASLITTYECASKADENKGKMHESQAHLHRSNNVNPNQTPITRIRCCCGIDEKQTENKGVINDIVV